MKTSTEMAKIAYKALDTKKGMDIKVIDISQVSVLADYFLIASGGSSPQIQAMLDEVKEKMHENGFHVQRVEGNRGSTWVLLEYGEIVVHIFDREDRLFYDLERLWSDGTLVDIDSL